MKEKKQKSYIVADGITPKPLATKLHNQNIVSNGLAYVHLIFFIYKLYSIEVIQ